MTDQARERDERNNLDRDGDSAPELHNSEQDDEGEQTQTIADEALHGEARRGSPLDSRKSDEPGEVMDDSSQDLVDHMRDMEQSGRIDMDAYRGEDNLDDNEDKYGVDNKVDPDLPSDGSGQPSRGARG